MVLIGKPSSAPKLPEIKMAPRQLPAVAAADSGQHDPPARCSRVAFMCQPAAAAAPGAAAYGTAGTAGHSAIAGIAVVQAAEGGRQDCLAAAAHTRPDECSIRAIRLEEDNLVRGQMPGIVAAAADVAAQWMAQDRVT